MYRFFLILFLILNVQNLIAQNQSKSVDKKSNELYFTINSFNPINISIKYKKAIHHQLYYKLGLLNISAGYNQYKYSNSNIFPTNQINASSGVECGLEFRKKLSYNIILFHGPNISFNYSFIQNISQNPALNSQEKKTTTHSYNLGIPYTLGIMFRQGKSFAIAAEINPNISYNIIQYRFGINPLKNYSNSQLRMVTSTASTGKVSLVYIF